MREHMSHQERRELWRERIAAFYDSGLSAAQFCAEHGLKPHQLWYWARRFRDEASHGVIPAFVSVVTEDAQTTTAPITLRVGKVEIDVRPGYDSRLLAELVHMLVTRPC
ncbi:IS66 family insertion sequence element accessory protein TnpB [Alicyclobacillus mali]|uniref:IS66 family insertion sequence element accessory protein TnpB n=1 Tax=Alicyclobacillus mali (ex Roth et al. 2021) TaxID=1123961 RepID=A0ABS0F590_9BACL|nr:IS66 family insertion sequence element accessory protein TnpB [Alicyclobacillus mali (ex Roth et al. 2021)]MBF8378463.1 IS66 family insertion sequence element accessory protein TnpB [Alicyclobacillus mali (ex Roth et al. 2021)]